MTRAELDQLIDTDILAAYDALEKVNWQNSKGKYKTLIDELIDPPIGSNKTQLITRLKLLLRTVLPAEQYEPETKYIDKYSWLEAQLIDTQFKAASLPPDSKLVDCNRIQELKNMNSHWETPANMHKFFFILSCSSQLPENLIRHFLYELEAAEAIDPDKIFMQYTRGQSGFNKSSVAYAEPMNSDRTTMLGVRELGALTNLKALKRDFYEQMNQFQNARDFKTPQQEIGEIYNSNQAFRDYIEQKLGSINSFENCAFAYTLNGVEWQHDPESLCSMLTTWLSYFNYQIAQGPRCHFFFIIKMPEIHLRSELGAHELKLFHCIQTVVQAYQVNAMLIDKLPCVKVDAIQTWIDNMLTGDARKTLFAAWYKRQYNETLLPNHELDMEIVSIFMHLLWSYAHKQKIAQS